MVMMAPQTATFGMRQHRQLLGHVHGSCLPEFCSNPTICVTKPSRYKAGFSLWPGEQTGTQ